MNTKQAEALVEADRLMGEIESSVRELRETTGLIRQWANQGQAVADVERRQSKLVAKVQSLTDQLSTTLRLENVHRSGGGRLAGRKSHGVG
ncbi:MAG: hypothetical protein ACKO7W_09040 [Elainella sp.]